MVRQPPAMGGLEKGLSLGESEQVRLAEQVSEFLKKGKDWLVGM